jgi:hypothetical protein
VVLISLLNHFAGHHLLSTLQNKVKTHDCIVTSVAEQQHPATHTVTTTPPNTGSIVGPEHVLSLEIPESRADRFPSVEDRLKV